MVRVGFIEKVALEQRFGGQKGVSMWVSGKEGSRQREQPVRRSEDSA